MPLEDAAKPKGTDILKGEGKEPTNGTPPTKTTPIEDAAAIKRAKIEEMQRQRAEVGARQKLQEGIKEAEAKGKIKDLPKNEREWLESDLRHKELAYDPDQKNFNVKEAQAAIKAEKQSLLKPPVKRAIDEYGGSRGGDYIDADGNYWDVKDASAGSNKIIDVLRQGENVLVDSSKLSKIELEALEKAIKAEMPKNGTKVRFVR